MFRILCNIAPDLTLHFYNRYVHNLVGRYQCLSFKCLQGLLCNLHECGISTQVRLYKCHCAETLDWLINVKVKDFYCGGFLKLLSSCVCFCTSSWCFKNILKPYTVEFFSKQIANNFIILVVDLFVLISFSLIGSSIKKMFWLPQIFYFKLSYFDWGICLPSMWQDLVLSNWSRPHVI